MTSEPAGAGTLSTPALATRVMVELLRAGQTVRFRARGTSMWPVIRAGATVEVTPCAADELRPGDVGAYVRGATLVVHRLARRRGRQLVFRGDGLGADDPVVDTAAVLGRARALAQPALRVRLPRPGEVRRAVRAGRAVAAAMLRRLLGDAGRGHDRR